MGQRGVLIATAQSLQTDPQPLSRESLGLIRVQAAQSTNQLPRQAEAHRVFVGERLTAHPAWAAAARLDLYRWTGCVRPQLREQPRLAQPRLAYDGRDLAP